MPVKSSKARATKSTSTSPATKRPAKKAARKRKTTRKVSRAAASSKPTSTPASPDQYRLIGADQHQYGPVSTEVLRQWLEEGRADGHSLVRIEGTSQWVPLQTVGGFKSLSATVPPPPLTPALDTRKSKLVAGLLGVLLGGLGIHRFYLGYIGIGIAQVVVTLMTCGAGQIWGLVEGILILTGSTITTDADGQSLKEV